MTTSIKIIMTLSLTVIVFSLISLVMLIRTNDVPPTLPEKKVDRAVRIAVLNGCGRSGLASVFAQKLRAFGFDVVNGMGENADSFDFDVSVVVNRKGDKSKAETVGQTLGIDTILEQRSDNPYIIEDVVVILGRDWNTLTLMKEEPSD